MISNYWIQLLNDLENYADRDLPNSSDHTKAQSSNCFIIHSNQFRHSNMLIQIHVELPSSFAFFLANSGYKRIFTQQIFLLYSSNSICHPLSCISAVFAIFFSQKFGLFFNSTPNVCLVPVRRFPSPSWSISE